jgi:carbonic anhydrase
MSPSWGATSPSGRRGGMGIKEGARGFAEVSGARPSLMKGGTRMSRKPLPALFALLLLCFSLAIFAQAATPQAQAILQKVVASNGAFMKAHGPEHFKPFLESQHPQITLVTCSDSRVPMHAMDDQPDGEVFVIRDIGNQIATCDGSVDYGVHHLHTPVLMILGHVRCGAVQAAMGDYSKEPASIRRELDTLKVKKGGAWLEEVEANVADQVKAALAQFGNEVKEGKLTVVGAVYDFADDLKEGDGKLVVININGETDPAKVKAFLAPPTP